MTSISYHLYNVPHHLLFQSRKHVNHICLCLRSIGRRTWGGHWWIASCAPWFSRRISDVAFDDITQTLHGVHGCRTNNPLQPRRVRLAAWGSARSRRGSPWGPKRHVARFSHLDCKRRRANAFMTSPTLCQPHSHASSAITRSRLPSSSIGKPVSGSLIAGFVDKSSNAPSTVCPDFW